VTECFEIASLETSTTCGVEATIQQRLPDSKSAPGGDDVHLLEFTDIRLAAFERCDSGAAEKPFPLLGDEISGSRVAVGSVQSPRALRSRIGRMRPSD
jgi:hypothetical protein